MSYRSFYDGRNIGTTEERKRLLVSDLPSTWRLWGPYLSERQWGTVRECYSSINNSWDYFSHDQARSRAYRWGEDGIAGIADLHQYLCFSLALWNERDTILKERLFGLTNGQGNHGEDVKEYYYYLDSTPTHSYMRYLYKYPYEFPYSALVNNSGSLHPLEYELLHTGAFDGNRYFDIEIEYAKNTFDDLLIKIKATNRGDEEKRLHLLPTLWYRNTWSWENNGNPKPQLNVRQFAPNGIGCIEGSPVQERNRNNDSLTEVLPGMFLYCKQSDELLFTENESNAGRLWHSANPSPFVKDGINEYVVSGNGSAVNPDRTGTKAAVHHALTLAAGTSATITLRLSAREQSDPFGTKFNQLFTKRHNEADSFYDALSPFNRRGNEGERDRYSVQRQAYAGMLWSKQLYYFIPNKWLKGDAITPPPEHFDWESTVKKVQPWKHMYSKDVMSMPDKWEYPWFAAWDLAFHTATLAMIDPAFAKYQLELLVMEYFQHPDGQIPAYEWDFSNINPPVHAWAALKVYETEKEIYGTADTIFLERVFNKLNLNFTWWINRVDDNRNGIFEGGFLGLDNIRIIEKGPNGEKIEQSDGTAWMAMFCLNMIRIAVELSRRYTGSGTWTYNDSARKYLQHFLYICDAMNRSGNGGVWDETEGFFMDCTRNHGPVRVFSMVGLAPLFATEFISQNVGTADSFYGLYGFIKWFVRNRADLTSDNTYINIDEFIDQVNTTPAPEVIKGTVSIVDRQKLERIFEKLFDPNGFLSPVGIRSLSKYHLWNTNVTLSNGWQYYVKYEPAESIDMRRMGGNSNWCGPVWMPVNYLIIEALRKYYRRYGPSFTVEYPKGSGIRKNLEEIADDLSIRLIGIFLRDPATGKRPVFGNIDLFQSDGWIDNLQFYEYFHAGDEQDRYAGAGLGASHQTGWTGLIANLLQEIGVKTKAAAEGIVPDNEEETGTTTAEVLRGVPR